MQIYLWGNKKIYIFYSWKNKNVYFCILKINRCDYGKS